MENGPIIFLLIGIAIIALALAATRVLRKPINRQMPGRDGRNNSTFWYGAGGRNHDEFDGGGGGGD